MDWVGSLLATLDSVDADADADARCSRDSSWAMEVCGLWFVGGSGGGGEWWWLVYGRW